MTDAAKERKRLTEAAWRARNANKKRVTDATWRARNADKVAAQKRARYLRNKVKVVEQARQWKANNRHRVRQYARKYHYGLSAIDVERMLAEQGGTCATCPKVLTGDAQTDVDHCHKTGRVRGLVCRRCNIRLGALDDDEFMARATAYLNRITSPAPSGVDAGP